MAYDLLYARLCLATILRLVALVSLSLLIGIVLVYPLLGVVFIPQCYLDILLDNPYVIGNLSREGSL